MRNAKETILGIIVMMFAVVLYVGIGPYVGRRFNEIWEAYFTVLAACYLVIGTLIATRAQEVA